LIFASPKRSAASVAPPPISGSLIEASLTAPTAGGVLDDVSATWLPQQGTFSPLFAQSLSEWLLPGVSQ
jgi:hypothetical protein